MTGPDLFNISRMSKVCTPFVFLALDETTDQDLGVDLHPPYMTPLSYLSALVSRFDEHNERWKLSCSNNLQGLGKKEKKQHNYQNVFLLISITNPQHHYVLFPVLLFLHQAEPTKSLGSKPELPGF